MEPPEGALRPVVSLGRHVLGLLGPEALDQGVGAERAAVGQEERGDKAGLLRAGGGRHLDVAVCQAQPVEEIGAEERPRRGAGLRGGGR